jgi:hypothetical protein
VVLGYVAQGDQLDFAYGTLTLFGQPFQVCSTIDWLCNSPTELQFRPAPTHYPLRTTLADFNMRRVWALPSSLAATGGIAFAFSSCGY